MKRIVWVVVAFVVISSFVLGFHNASIYEPNHGFDGSGHVYYIQYLVQNKKIPPPTAWETHQPPFYYIIGATVVSIFGTMRSAQYINIFVLWAIIGMVGLGLRKVFKDRDRILLGMFALAALPMLNIFLPTVTNELLNTFMIISAAIACLYLLSAKNRKQVIWCSVWLAASLVLGIWTKISIITILPTVGVAFLIFFIKHKTKRPLILTIGITTIILFIVAAVPLFMRGAQTKGPSNVVNTMASIKATRTLDFYFRLDWIPKVDMYNTQYYSMLGAAWNSFFMDGHNVITPFIKFHKKGFILWSLGFVLLPLSLYGLWQLWRKQREVAIVINIIGLSMLTMYVIYNLGNHYSAARLTYEMAIVIPYSFGIAGSAVNKKMKILLFVLLGIQFITLLSFFWILPWWNVTKELLI
ncbi:MAG: glycosyltransferase family 39 protein [bacterium]